MTTGVSKRKRSSLQGPEETKADSKVDKKIKFKKKRLKKSTIVGL